MTDLATEDLLGVELVRAGGPFYGQGSAAAGDYITTAQLGQAVAAFNELRDELWPPVKLGHNDVQDALRHDGHITPGAPPNPGLFDTDGAPAAGWLDNLRVDGDRLLSDWRKVPRVVAELVRVGAYRARSIEFWRNYRDASGKRHPFVVTGVALLGAKLPAVRGLRDLVTLYRAELDADETVHVAQLAGAPQDEGVRVFFTAAPGSAGLQTFAVSDAYLPLADPDRGWDEAEARKRVLTWAGVTEDPTDGTDAAPLPEAALAKLRSAYLYWADGGGRTLADFNYLVADVVDGQLRAIPAAVYAAAERLAEGGLDGPDLPRVQNRLGAFYAQLGATPPWGGTQGADTAPAMDEWAARKPTPETEGTMPQTVAPELLAALGVGEDADLDAAVAQATKLAEKAGQVDGLQGELSAAKDRVTALETDSTEGQRKLADEVATLRELAQDGVEARKELTRLAHERIVDDAVRERKLTPGQRDEWLAKLDAAPGPVSDLIATLPVRSDLAAGESGTDDKGDTEDEAQAQSEDATYTAAFGEKPRTSAAPRQEA